MSSKVVIKRKKQTETASLNLFGFSKSEIPGLGENDGISQEVVAYRKAAWKDYESLPFPTTKDEAWRRTDISKLFGKKFNLPSADSDRLEELDELPEDLLRPVAGDEYAGQIVFSAQKTEAQLNNQYQELGVVFTDLMSAEVNYPELLSQVRGKVVRSEEGKFAALAGAMARRGVFIYIPENVVIDKPLHSVIWGPGSGLAYFSHIVIHVAKGASLTFVHEAASPAGQDGENFHAGIVEILLEDNAHLKFVELQSWGENVWNFSHERAHIHRDANLEWVFGAVGSHLTKNFTDINLVGQGAVGKMSGFYFTDDTQHLDHDTQQNHLAPDTTSDLLFKGALKDRSRSVWQGMIYVAPGAQKTDGYQANRNLILDPKARADSIPGLEILADDVRCTHGATVGKIDTDQIFYLRSRGIPEKEAEKLIVYGFFEPIMQRIPFVGVRMRFQQAIIKKIGSAEFADNSELEFLQD